MDTTSAILALIGGGLIGLAAGAFLILNGRIAGISGVFGGLLSPKPGENAWRAAFIGGLVLGGLALAVVMPSAFPETVNSSSVQLIGAGLLVGFGTRLGSGCTSGHGVCGLARLSPRSLVATVVFISTGAMTVFVARHVIGG